MEKLATAMCQRMDIELLAHKTDLEEEHQKQYATEVIVKKEMTDTEEDFRPAPTRSETYMGPVEGPENARTENVTIRSKPVSVIFFEEAPEQTKSINRLIEEAEKILIGFDKGMNHDNYENNRYPFSKKYYKRALKRLNSENNTNSQEVILGYDSFDDEEQDGEVNIIDIPYTKNKTVSKNILNGIQIIINSNCKLRLR